MWREIIAFAAAALFMLPLVGCRGAQPLSDLRVEPAAITPDGDGNADVARISYSVGRPARLTIQLVGPDGQTHPFRDDLPRQPGSYEALFGGVIDGRMLPDGDYSLRVSVRPDDGSAAAEAQAALAITGGDTTPPRLEGLALAPDSFSPNQDGMGDRVKLSYSLSEAAAVRLWLETADGTFVQDILEDLDSADKAGQVGPHTYDFDGGVDADSPPPPDGDYLVLAEARDSSGNVTRQSLPLAIRQGGQPRAALVGDVDWSDSVVSVGATLWFTVTVRNVGATPLRSFGPPPGYVYDSNRSFNQRAPRGTWILARQGRPASSAAAEGNAAVAYRAASRWVPDGPTAELLLELQPVDPLAAAARRDPFGPAAGSSASGASVASGASTTTAAISSTEPTEPTAATDALAAITPATAPLCGQVRSGGAAAGGAEVYAFDATAGKGRRAVADAAGRFCFPPLADQAPEPFAPSPGALRIGLACDALESDVDYPFRWQLGAMETLDVCDVAGRLYLCLAPGAETVVSGGLRFVQRPNRRGTKVYLSLQHEDVRMIQGPFGIKGLTVEGE